MGKIYLLSIFILLVLLWVGSAASQDISKDVDFPITELGNCLSEEECQTYCDNPENALACLDFAEVHNLMSEQEIKTAREMLQIMERAESPGECRNETECDIYCNNPDHMEECITFGKKHGLIPPEELEEVEMVLKTIKKGIEPPPCQGGTECDIYCSKPEHMEECLDFAEAAGFMSAEEAEIIRKTGGKGPGGCQGKTKCDAFCQNPGNMEECLNFALEHGLMSPEEEKESRIMLQVIKKGVKMPACQSKEECDIYCSRPEHMKECLDFAEAAGFVLPEEAKMIREGNQKGPGGCQSREECDVYCDKPEHIEECLNFAVKTGMMTQEEVENAQKMGELEMIGGPGGCQSKEECEFYCQDLAHMEECMNFGQQEGLISPEQAETAKMFGPVGPGGPGGCKSKEECEAYCSQPEHTDECLGFSVEQGMMGPEEAEKMKEKMMGPLPEGMFPGIIVPPELQGKCANPEECKQYCLQNPQEPICKQFLEEKPLEEGYISPEGKMMTPSSGDEIKPSGEMMSPPGEEMKTPSEGFFEKPSGEIILPPPGEEDKSSSLPSVGEETPQSFFEAVKYFLAGLTLILEK